MDPHEILDARLADQHWEEVEREAEAQARVDQLKTLTMEGLMRMEFALEVTGISPSIVRDQAPSEYWMDALMDVGDKQEEAAIIFDAAIKIVARDCTKSKTPEPPEHPNCRPAQLAAAEARLAALKAKSAPKRKFKAAFSE